MTSRMRRRLFALDCAHAYLQWFCGIRFRTPAERAEADAGYRGSVRALREHYFGGRKGHTP